MIHKDVFEKNLINDVIQNNIGLNLKDKYNIDDLKYMLANCYKRFCIRSEPKEIGSEPIKDNCEYD